MSKREDKKKNKKPLKEDGLAFEKLQFDEVTVYKTTIPAKMKMRKPYVPVDVRLVTAFIPGTVVDVLVKKGDKVKKGDRLLVLNAMKMDNNLTAPFDGTIGDMPVKKGDIVPKNTLLAIVEPEQEN